MKTSTITIIRDITMSIHQPFTTGATHTIRICTVTTHHTHTTHHTTTHITTTTTIITHITITSTDSMLSSMQTDLVHPLTTFQPSSFHALSPSSFLWHSLAALCLCAVKLGSSRELLRTVSVEKPLRSANAARRRSLGTRDPTLFINKLLRKD